jgi:hypothetical protein
MNGLDYDRLWRITQTEKPYRGTTDRFPVSDRRHNLKNFYVKEENGVRVFDVTYGTRWKSHDLTKEQYEEMEAAGAKDIHKYEYTSGTSTVEKTEYKRYEVSPFRIGTVYPEGYFQFNADTYYGQGDRSFLSDCSNGWFSNDSRRGGMVWTFGQKAFYRCIPIFKGMRVSTKDNFEVLDDYVVVGKKVNRKVGKDLLGGYEAFYRTAETMCKAMSREIFLETAKEILDEKERDHKKYFDAAEELREQAPLDAMILYALALGVGRIDQHVRHPSWHQGEPHEIFCNLKRKMNHGLYKEHPEVFVPVQYGKGEAYPPSIWGYEVVVNGEVQQQY